MSLFHHQITESYTTYLFRAWERPEGWSWTVNVKKQPPDWEDVDARSAWTVVHDPDYELTREQICEFALEQCKKVLDA